MRTPATTLSITIAAILCGGCITTATSPTAPEATGTEPTVIITPAPAVGEMAATAEPLAPEATAIEGHGIRVESLRLSGAGLLIDFRYKVIDVAEASKVVNRKIQPYIVDQATGHEFRVPHAQKIGTLRHMGGMLQDGRSYSMLFANPGRTIKSGAKVNLVVGQLRLEDLTVE